MSLFLDDEPIGRRRVLIHTSSDESEEAVVIADFGNGMIEARTRDGKIWIGNRWEDLSGPFAPIRHGGKHLRQERTSESAFCAQRPPTLGPNMEGSIQSDYVERLKSRDLIPMEQVLHLLGFTESRVGGYERKWGKLEVECTEWLGSWHFICSWVNPREMGIPEFRLGSPISPAGLLATLYNQCGDAFRQSPFGLPKEFAVGKEEVEYQRKTRALTPQAPTVWADREFLRFCFNYIGSNIDRLTSDSTITFSASNGQLRIDCAQKQPLTIYCPATGEWLGASEVSAEDLYRRLPKRFNGRFIALRQQGDKVIIGSQIVPSRFIEKD